jgi:hypothetical protein
MRETTHLPRSFRSRLENPRLHIRWQIRINRTNHQFRHLVPQRPSSLFQILLRRFNLVLTREEDEDVALWLGRVDLEDGGYGGVEVVGFGLGGVKDVDGVATTGN